MALVRTLEYGNFMPDEDAQLVAGDLGAETVIHNGAPVWAFDDTDEEAIVSQRFPMPSFSGTLTLVVYCYTASDNTNDVALDAFVEAITPGDTPLDLEAATSWAAANSGTASVSGSTAGDLFTVTITLNNNDSVAENDLVRIGIRRDTDSANDDIVGDVFIAAARINDTA